MTVGSCVGWGCGRLVSMTELRQANPVALAEPEAWAVEFRICVDCKSTLCDRCARKRGGRLRGPSCPRCAGRMVDGRRRWSRVFERPDPPEVIAYQEGMSRGEAGRWEEALRAFDTALRLRPSYPHALLYRAVTLRQLGRTDEAVSVLDDLLRLDPRNAQAAFDKGAALSAAGRADEAADAYRTAIGIEPGYGSARVNLAILLLDRGEAPAALKLCEEAVRLFETGKQAENAALLAYALAAEGAALLACGRPREALDRLDRAVDEGLEDSQTHHNRARALAALGRQDEAAQARRLAEDLARYQ
ncbi:tetratricopeptide repeat protein [Saccharomonospora xinjiangensis]|nr:lipoprotein NlpI [Saccharomonospora xinjiangensis]